MQVFLVVSKLFTLWFLWKWDIFVPLRYFFLVGAFLEKRVDYSHGFLSVFFFNTPGVTKIVLPKVLQNLKLCLLAHGTEAEGFSFFFRVLYNTGRVESVPLLVFLQPCAAFFQNFFPPKGPPFNFLEFCDRMDVEKSQRIPLSVFSALWEYLDTLKSFCYFWALDMAPTWAGLGLFYVSRVLVLDEAVQEETLNILMSPLLSMHSLHSEALRRARLKCCWSLIHVYREEICSLFAKVRRIRLEFTNFLVVLKLSLA